MAERIEGQAGSRYWRCVEIAGRLTLAGGLGFIIYSLDAAIRAEERVGGNSGRVLTGCAVLFFGFMIAVAARRAASIEQ